MVSIFGESPTKTGTPFLWLYWPVRMHAREGAQIGCPRPSLLCILFSLKQRLWSTSTHQHHLEGWVHICRLLIRAPHSESLWAEVASCSSLLDSGIPPQASLPLGPSRSCLLSSSVAYTLGVSLLASLGACVLQPRTGSGLQAPAHTHTGMTPIRQG